MKEFKLFEELEKVEKLTIKGVYSPGESVRIKAEITWKKLGQCFTEEIRAEFRNFQKAWENSYLRGD